MLCELCQQIRFSASTVHVPPDENGCPLAAVIHHKRPGDLEEGAQNGRHLCTTIWHALERISELKRSTVPETEERILLYVYHNTSIDLFTEDQRDELRVDVHCGGLKAELQVLNLLGKYVGVGVADLPILIPRLSQRADKVREALENMYRSQAVDNTTGP